MAKVKKEEAPNRIIEIQLGENFYQVLKDRYSFNLFKRNGQGNMASMGSYPSTFGRTLEIILDDATRKSSTEVQSIREYINEIRSIYDQLREVKAEWQVIGKKSSDGSLGIPELPPIEESVEEEEEDEF